MEKIPSTNSKRRVVLYIVSTVVLINMIVGFIAMSLNGSWHRNEVIMTTDRYIDFQYRISELLDGGTVLLKGFEAYMQVNDGQLAGEQIDSYLSFLTTEDMESIRNIAVIEDTTIIYNFPLEGNESSLGIDLSKIEGQRDIVLRTKEEGMTAFQGPVDLVQGGQGFIIRVPFYDSNDTYWGQMSIVLRADIILDQFALYAEEDDLDVVIYEHAASDRVIFGNEAVMSNNPISFNFNSELNGWVIHVIPRGGWDNFADETILIILLGMFVSVIVGFAVYYLHRANRRLQESLAHDPLTGLYNRYHLEETQRKIYNEALLTNSNFGLMHIDLDRFKSVNDNYGHNAGDEVLVETARILEHLTREEELVFRIGGDEFLIMAPSVDNKHEMVKFKERIYSEFRVQYSLWDKYDVDIGPSIGVGLYPLDGNNFDAVFVKADEEMYSDKRIHKNEELSS